MNLFKRKPKANKESDQQPSQQLNMQTNAEVNDNPSSRILDEENMTQEERQQHSNDISNRFIAQTNFNDQDLEQLSIQDMCILIENSKYALTNHMFVDRDEYVKNLISRFYETLIKKIQNSNLLYTVIDNTTSYPFIDENAKDCVWLFSCKKYAENAVDYYTQQYRNFSIKEISAESLKSFFVDLYYIGTNGAYIDNGLAGCVIKKEDMIEPPNWENVPQISIPVMNPEFMLAHLKMTQEISWKVGYPEREQVLDRLEMELSKQSLNSKFLVPTKGMPKAKDNEHEITLKEDTHISIPCLTGKDDARAIPVFTDWQQFRLCYSDQEYSGWIMSFDDIADMIKGGSYDAFVINIGKCPMEVTAKSLERVYSLVNKE